MLQSAKISSLPDASKDIRSKKILELKNRCPGLVERIHDTEFSLSFSSLNVNYELTITLPSGFPFIGPVLQVRPPAIHPLLDESSTVCGVTDLTAFSIHASVPDIVHQVLSHFITTPLRRQERMAQQHRATSSGQNMYTNAGGYRPATSMYPQVKELSVEDLREWSTNDMKVNEFVESMVHVKARQDMIRSMSDANVALAQSNLGMCELVDPKRANVLSLKDDLSQLQAEFFENQKKFQKLAKSYVPETIKDDMRKAAQDAEEESEVLAEQFYHKELGLEDFLKSFMKIRTLYHERSAKADALEKQLQQLHNARY